MHHTQFDLIASDGETLYAQSWAPDTPQALVCLLHGYGEHSSRYTHVAAALVEAGYSVVAIDQRGHGRSGGDRGYTPAYDQSLEDVGLLLESGRERFPDLPTFLYGHSMGGGMVLRYVLDFQPQLAGVVASSPWLQLAEAPSPALVTLSKVAGFFYPRFAIDQGPYEGGVLSRDPEMDAAFDPDPLTHGRMSTKLFSGATSNGRTVIANAARFPLPLLLMHGTGDKLIACGGSEAFYANAPQEKVTFKTWEGFYHELHNDLGREEVIAFLLDWLNGRLAAVQQT